MAPDPITKRFFGIFNGVKACLYVQTSLPSASIPGSSLARAPVARIIFFPVIFLNSPSILMPMVELSNNLASPEKTVTLFFFKRYPTP